MPLRCFKCKKYGHQREAWSGRQTCARCGENDPDHLQEDCLKEIRCANCRQAHPAFVRSCDVYIKEKEILEVQHKRNMSFLEAKKIVGTNMGENSYASVAPRVDTTNEDNKYRKFVDKLIQLEANDRSKFQEHLIKLHLDEFDQAPAKQQVGNGERVNVVVKTKTLVRSTILAWTTPKRAKSPAKQPLHKSPIRPPKSIKDRLKNFSPIKSEQLKQKSEAPISQAGKIQMNTKMNNEKPGSAFKMHPRTKSPIRIKQLQCSGIDKIPTKKLNLQKIWIVTQTTYLPILILKKY